MHLVEREAGYRSLVEMLRTGGQHDAVVLDAARPCLVAALHRELGLPALLITHSVDRARQMVDQLQVWGGDALHFPAPDRLPYEQLPSDPSTVQQRIAALQALGRGAGNPLVVASAHAVAWKTAVPTDFMSAVHTIAKGMRFDIESTLAMWVDIGYEHVTMVEVPGSFSRRGGIIDIFSPSSELPARVELFGDRVESIRLFDPMTQRSLRIVDSITVLPAGEETGSGSVINYLPGNALLILDQPDDIARSLETLDDEAQWVRTERISRGEFLPDSPVTYLTWEQMASLAGHVNIQLSFFSWQPGEEKIALPFKSAPEYGGRLDAFLRDTEALSRGKKKRIVIVSLQARRLSELFEENDIVAPPRDRVDRLPPRGTISLIQGSLSRGWSTDSTVLLTDAEIFGYAKVLRRMPRRFHRRPPSLSELSVGDYVVHVEHGIARFAGTVMMKVGETEREYLALEYAAGDRLYVPAEQIDRVARYVGSGDAPPRLTRLGTRDWTRAKRRVRQATIELARELRDLYAIRNTVQGVAFSPDTEWQEEMEAAFPYIETPDQARAVAEVKRDMQQPRPMDRLVCGDVGYGKTEVAIRAAFKAVQDGAQVAVLVPTTLLAQQHYDTFSQRLAAFPLNIAMLSRFCSGKEQEEVVKRLGVGTVDIVIGTHRLLQKDVSFRNLGLAIIDEEQRFGVAHKEHLKKLRREVDVLTLTATPIPRTLYMSLSGVRDMSTMETPPEERLPVKTTVSEYDERLIREAILREMERGGQVFFVHNRVNSIRRVAASVESLVPEAKVATAHGRMDEEQLEAVMLDFVAGNIDVLVVTTIIESGLDIPNVNTLIVNDADKMGLAQLYQLRGRVGRGTSRAYAYFLYSRGKRLTYQAQRRLQTIFEATELGAGFRIAMRDLEIRGGGNLLGPEQSGHIGAVGFDLYCRLLQEAVVGLEGASVENKPHRGAIAIDLPLKAYLPATYIDDLDMRLAMYQCLSNISAEGQVEEVATEIEDRFGPMPDEVADLLYAIKVKVLSREAGVGAISTEGHQLLLKMQEDRQVDGAVLQRLSMAGVRAGKTMIRLDLRHVVGGWRRVLEEMLRHLAMS